MLDPETVYDISPNLLEQPFSLSRKENQIVNLRETLASRLHNAAAILGINPTDNDKDIALPSELNFPETKNVIIKLLEIEEGEFGHEYGITNPGKGTKTLKEHLEEIKRGEDDSFIDILSYNLLSIEQHAKVGKVRLIENVPLPDFSF